MEELKVEVKNWEDQKKCPICFKKVNKGKCIGFNHFFKICKNNHLWEVYPMSKYAVLLNENNMSGQAREYYENKKR